MSDAPDTFEDDDVDTPSLPVKRGHGRVTGQARILARENQRRALEMRKAGATFDAIAQTLGYSSASGAYNAVKTAMDAIIQEPVDDLRRYQYERLNHMLVTLWPKVNNGDERAISEARGIMRDMNELMGANAPLKTEVNVQGAIIVADVDSGDYIAAMQRIAAGGVVHNGMRGLDEAIEVSAIEAGIVEESFPVHEEVRVTTDPPDERPKRRRKLSLTED